MAVAYRSSTSTTYASRTNTTVTPPAGLANDDILLAGLFAGASGTSPAVTAPAGFSEHGSPTSVTNGGFNGKLHVYWKRASSESGSYTFTHSAASTQCLLIAVSGAITSGSPIDVSSSNTGTGDTTTFTGVATTVANTLLLALAHDWEGTGAVSTPSGFTRVLDGLVMGAYASQAAAGASGNKTYINGNFGALPWAAVLVAIKEATGGSSQSLTPAKHTNTNTFFAPSVSRGVRNLVSAKYTPSNTFFTATIARGVRALVAGKYTNANSFYASTVNRGSVTLSPAKYTNANAFYALNIYDLGDIDDFTINGDGYLVKNSDGSLWTYVYDENGNPIQNGEGQFYIRPADLTLEPGLLANANTFYAHQIEAEAEDQTLVSSLFVNSNSFYSAQVGSQKILSPGYFASTNSFYGHVIATGQFFLAPSLFSNVSAFFAPTIDRGGVTVTTVKHVNANTFHSPVVETVSDLLPSLFANSNIFYQASATSVRSISPNFITSPDSFYGPTVARGPVTLQASLFQNVSAIYTPFVGTGGAVLQASLFANSTAFHIASISAGTVSLAPALYTNASTFFAPDILRGGISVLPPMLANVPVLYSPVVSSGESFLAPTLYNNANAFYTARVNLSVKPIALTNSNTFFDSSVTPGPVALSANKFENVTSFHGTSIKSTIYLTATKHVNGNTIYLFHAYAFMPLRPPFLGSANIFYSSLLTSSFVPEILPGRMSSSIRPRIRMMASKNGRNRAAVSWYQN